MWILNTLTKSGIPAPCSDGISSRLLSTIVCVSNFLFRNNEIIWLSSCSIRINVVYRVLNKVLVGVHRTYNCFYKDS